MGVGAVIKAKREEMGWTQARLSKAVGTHESTLRMCELELRPTPHDVAARAGKVLREPDIPLAKCAECSCNWFLSSLDGVDTHPVVEIQAVLTEAAEAIEAVKALDLRNKRTLSPAELPALERAIDQVFDLIPLAVTAIASWCRTYGLDMEELHKRHQRKLEMRGYTRKEVQAA